MKKVTIAIMAASVMLLSCESKTKTTEGSSSEATVQTAEKNAEEKGAICLLDKLSIRETAEPKGKWITSMSLGEQVKLTGEEQTNEATKKLYVKVQLTDGKEGWTPARFLAIDGKVGVMQEAASVYKRPDLLTKTEKKYSVMDIIAVTENQGDWVKVKGKRAEGQYIEEGWIKSANISNNAVDIAAAKFASMAMAKPTMTERIAALQELLKNSDLSSSSFISVIEAKIKDYESKNTPIDVQDVKVDEEKKEE